MPKSTPSKNSPKRNRANKLHSGYFEAIIQVRPENEEILRFIKRRVDERETVFVSRVERLKEGVDLYISSQRYAITIGRRLKKAYKKGTLHITRSLFSRSKHTGKNIYRVTVLFRLES